MILDGRYHVEDSDELTEAREPGRTQKLKRLLQVRFPRGSRMLFSCTLPLEFDSLVPEFCHTGSKDLNTCKSKSETSSMV